MCILGIVNMGGVRPFATAQNVCNNLQSQPSLVESMGGSPGDVSEEPMKKGWRMSCDVGEATERLENEL